MKARSGTKRMPASRTRMSTRAAVEHDRVLTAADAAVERRLGFDGLV